MFFPAENTKDVLGYSKTYWSPLKITLHGHRKECTSFGDTEDVLGFS